VNFLNVVICNKLTQKEYFVLSELIVSSNCSSDRGGSISCMHISL